MKQCAKVEPRGTGWRKSGADPRPDEQKPDKRRPRSGRAGCDPRSANGQEDRLVEPAAMWGEDRCSYLGRPRLPGQHCCRHVETSRHMDANHHPFGRPYPIPRHSVCTYMSCRRIRHWDRAGTTCSHSCMNRSTQGHKTQHLQKRFACSTPRSFDWPVP